MSFPQFNSNIIEGVSPIVDIPTFLDPSEPIESDLEIEEFYSTEENTHIVNENAIDELDNSSIPAVFPLPQNDVNSMTLDFVSNVVRELIRNELVKKNKPLRSTDLLDDLSNKEIIDFTVDAFIKTL